MLAVDISNWTGWQPQYADRLWEAGVRKVIVQVVDPPKTFPASVFRQQIPDLIAKGFEVEAYGYLWFGYDPVAQANYWMEQLYPWKGSISKFWVDVEDTSFDTTPEIRSEALGKALAACNMPVGIYTAKWYWDWYMGFTEAYKDYPLWVAQYDNVNNLDFVKFGGWVSCEIKQTVGDTQLNGVPSLDLNFYGTQLPELRTLPLDQSETVDMFRRIGSNAVAIVTDNGATAELIVDTKYIPRKGNRAYIVEVPE